MKIIQGQKVTSQKQQGVVTIFFTLMLVTLMSILAMTSGKLAMVEQESTGASYRAAEAAEATTAAMEYALAWLDDGHKCTNCTAGTSLDFEGASVANAEMPNISYTGGTGYVYNPSVTITVSGGFASGYLLVKPTLDSVVGNAESGVSITGSEQVYITQWNRYMKPGSGSAPPIVVNGCLIKTVGNPKIYPRPNGAAILTVATGTPIDWTDSNAPDGYCLDPGHMDIVLCDGEQCGIGESGSGIPPEDLEPYLAGIDLNAELYPQAWNYLFSISLPDAKELAYQAGQSTNNKNNITELHPANDDYMPFIVYTGSNPIHGTFGTIDYPVVLIVSHENCPQFNGGSTIYGYLYYENPLGTCNGMGGATVIGAAVFEGNAVKLNANTEFFSSALLGDGELRGPLFVEHGIRIPGTWRDW